MAAANSVLCEEQLSCSICLGAFTEPVSTPCGHNYCKACITGYWARCDMPQCPLCKKKFRNRPKLQVNTEFRDMVQHFNSMVVKSEDEAAAAVAAAKPGEVPCDICLGPKLKAQKTCLVCLASYCQPHLEPHQRVAALKKHKLIDPVSDLEDRVCKKHDKMFELFCQVEHVCVCFMCLKDDHVMHETVPLARVFQERKAHLESATSEMKMMEDVTARYIADIQFSMNESKKEFEKEIADIEGVFAGLEASLQRAKAELTAMVRKRESESAKTGEDSVALLQRAIDESRKKRSKIEQLLQTEDHVRLLQSWSSLDLRFPDEDFSDSTPASACSSSVDPPPETGQQNYLEVLKQAVTQMENILSVKMLKIRGVRTSDGCDGAELLEAAGNPMSNGFIENLWCPPQDRLMMIQQCDAMDVTLDAYSANARLLVSEDGKRLSLVQGPLLGNTLFRRRFEHQPFVVATEGFSSGRFYYEVDVSRSRGWVLGVVKESYDKLSHMYPCPENGGWTLTGLFTYFQMQCYYNFFSDPIRLPHDAQTVGVFVDYEKGEVSFYDVNARTVIYSYTGCNFIETAAPVKALIYSLTGTPLTYRPKLYPVFGIQGGDPENSLIITPVAGAT